MKLNTGKQEFKLEFDNGNVESIYFNPNDPDLAVRLEKFGQQLSAKIDEIAEFEESSEIEKFEKMQKIVCEEMDIAFGGDIADKVFKYCSPFAIVSGEYFIIQFINGISPEIQKRIEKASGDIKNKMKKHLGKYSK